MMSERFRKGWYLNLSIWLGALGPYFQLQFGWHHVKNQPQSRLLLPEFKMAPTSKAFHMESQIKMHCYLPPWWWLNIKTSYFLVNTFISTAMSSRVGLWLLAFPFLHFFRHAFGDFCTYKNLLQRNSHFFCRQNMYLPRNNCSTKPWSSGNPTTKWPNKWKKWCLCLLPS